MGQSLAANLSNNLLVRTGVVTLVLVGFFAVATGALPVRCMIGGKCDVANLPAAPTQSAAPMQTAVIAPEQAVVPSLAGVAMVKPVIQKVAPPSLTHNDVLAGTFAQLKVELKAPVSTMASRVAKAPDPTKPESDSGLTTRMVRAVTINPDGTPNFGSGMAEAYASNGQPAVIVPPSPALDAAVEIGAGKVPAKDDTVAVAEASPVPDVTPPSTPAPVAKGSAIVVGKGANVRANPSRGGKVLFALSGGETVKIVENKRGWLHVTDDQGRSGWIYSDFVKRGG